MTAAAAPLVPCPQPGCTYRAGNAGSIPAHLAMVHPEVPVDALEAAAPEAPVDDADEVVRALSDLRAAWRDAGAEARALLVSRVYRRVTVAGGEFVSVELTPEAERMGLALALPETVVLARPARLELTAFRSAT